jgi:lambda repressor-like predicted transcriptional regulator
MQSISITLFRIMTTENKNTIAQQLREKTGEPITKLAKKLQVSRNSIYAALEGLGSRSMRVAIAATLETKPSTLWRTNDRVVRACDDVCYREYLNEKNSMNSAAK